MAFSHEHPVPQGPECWVKKKDAVSLLMEKWTAEDLKKILDKLGEAKGGNESALALRVAEHMSSRRRSRGTDAEKCFRESDVKDCLRELGLPINGEDHYVQFADELKACYDARMEVRDEPWDLKNRKLYTKSLKTLNILCKQRLDKGEWDQLYGCGAPKKANSLVRWKEQRIWGSRVYERKW